MKHRGTKILSLLLSFVLLLSLLPGMSLTAYAAGEDITSNIIIRVGTSCKDDGHTVSSYVKDEYTVKEGVVVTFECKKYFNDAVTIYLNGTAVATWSGYDYDSKYVWTAKKDAKINWAGYSQSSANIYLTETSTVDVTGITLDPDAASMTVGGTQTLTATVSPDNATDKTVKWSVGGTDAGAVTLYSDTACTAPLALNTAIDTLTVYAKGTAAGSATVTVTSNADATKSASCAVTVSAVTYTVTYDANGGSGEMKPTKVSKNDEGKYIYKVESCGFTAPEGKTFDFWQGSDGREYRVGGEYELTGDITLKAQWKEEKKPDGGEKKTSGGGSGFDLVFNIPGADNSWEYVGGYVAPQQAYRVSLAPMQGGSAALGLTTGESGVQMNVYPTTTVYVFPNAAQGYVLDKIVWSLIDGSASYDITEAKNFVMPAMDVVVYVTFQPLAS